MRMTRSDSRARRSCRPAPRRDTDFAVVAIHDPLRSIERIDDARPKDFKGSLLPIRFPVERVEFDVGPLQQLPECLGQCRLPGSGRADDGNSVPHGTSDARHEAVTLDGDRELDNDEGQIDMEISDIGRWILLAGLGLTVLGGVLMLADRVPWLGRLPGDFTWQWGNTSVYLPLGTMIVLSLVLTIVVNVIARLFR